MGLGRKRPTHTDEERQLLEQLHQEWPEPEPQRQTQSRPAARSTPVAPPRRNRVQQHLDDRVGRLIAEGFMLLVWSGLWVVNAIFTVQGFALVGISAPLGFLLHLGITKGEHHLWKGQLDPVALLTVLVLVVIDVGTTLMGLLTAVSFYTPTLLGPTPTDLWQWQSLFLQPAPEWWPRAAALLALSALVALSSEFMIRKFWYRFWIVWNGD